MRENNSEYKIKVNNVSKVFKMYDKTTDKMKEAFSLSGRVYHRDFYAITNLSFEVARGEILGIMGRNGSGKSTLLKMITGIYEPTTGEIDVSGRISSLLELGTGFNLEYTGIENIYFYGTLMGYSRKQMDERLDSIIEFAEIGDYVFQPVKTYSSGMFARLAFSCAINVEPDILIVDEILSVGDMRFQSKCFNKFKEFKERGVTILYVGHDVGMMRTFCDKAMWINKGQLVDIGDPTFITAKYTEFMYLDDISEFTDYKLLGSEVKAEENTKQEIDVVVNEIQEPTKSEIIVSDSKFSKCIAHWGSRTGLIKVAKICDEKLKERNNFFSTETINVVIEMDIPDDISVSDLSVAVSLKNIEGTDLIVKTTFDEDLILKNGLDQRIIFELKPQLANGDYYLVVALENRENASISYFEYIEGAAYFKMYSEKKIFGIYDVDSVIRYYA